MRRKQQRKRRSQRKRQNLVRLKPGFWKRLFVALPVLLLTILLTFLLIRRDTLHELAADSQDLVLRLTSQSKDSRVTVVMIGDEDEKEFKKDGALNPAKLSELISAVAKGNPKVIGVDIETSDARYRDFQFADQQSPVVWVRSVYQPANEPIPETPTPRDVLGGQKPELNTEAHSGLLLLYDINHATRLYQRLTQTTEGNVASFPWAVAKRFDPKISEQNRATTDYLVIDFAGAPSEDLSASTILKLAKEPPWSNNDRIKDRIVLIGVGYEGQDRHQTPLGERPGVYSMAAAIETELNGGGIRQPGQFAFLPLWILQGIGLVILFQYFPLREAIWKNLAWSLALIVGSSVLCSVIASFLMTGAKTFAWLVYLAYFLPVGVLLFVEQLRDMLNDWRKEKIAQVSQEVSDVQRLTEKGDGGQ